MRFYTTQEKQETKPGCWNYLAVSVHQVDDDGTDSVIGSYIRNYSSMYSTFHPFQKGGGWYALYSKDYQTTSLMELPSCRHVADGPSGFCPVDFYVPDGKFFNTDGSEPELEAHAGTFGFVAGCVWGDDSGGWKCEYLDLSCIEEGILVQDGRLGYFELPYYKELKECFRISWFDDGVRRISINKQCWVDLDEHTYHPDEIRGFRKASEGDIPWEDLRKVADSVEVPVAIIKAKLAETESRLSRLQCDHHNLCAAIRRKDGKEKLKEYKEYALS